MVKFIKEKKQQIPINKVQHKRETITNESSKYKTSWSNLNMRLNTYVIATKLISLKSDEFHTKIDAVFAPNSLRSRELWSFRSALQSYTKDHRNFSFPFTSRFARGRGKSADNAQCTFLGWQREAFSSCSHQGKLTVLECTEVKSSVLKETAVDERVSMLTALRIQKNERRGIKWGEERILERLHNS